MRQSSRTPVLIMPSFHEVELPQIAFGHARKLEARLQTVAFGPFETILLISG
jgi:hypothetical protein